jgi:hypothetical protein
MSADAGEITTKSSTSVKSFWLDGEYRNRKQQATTDTLRVRSPIRIATARLFASACPLRSEISVYAQFEQWQGAGRAEKKKWEKFSYGWATRFR